MDIIFTDAVLMCIGPDKIKKVLKEFMRVGRKALILNEWHAGTKMPVYDDHWIYNYIELFSEFVPQNRIQLTKIPPELWGGNWAKYGYITEISL